MATCTKCRARLPAQQGPGRRRTMCENCSPRDLRKRSSPPSSTTPPEPPGPGVVESTVRGELERVDRLTTVAGAIAVRLAQRLDATALTGSQAASLSAQLLKTMAVALEGTTPPVVDEVDEFTARLRDKRDSA